MGKFFTDSGAEVEAFSKEETEKMIADAKAAEAARLTAEAEGAKAKADEGKQKTDLDVLLERVARIEGENKAMRIDKYAGMFAGTDSEKRKQFAESFNRLTGYEENEQGFELRAKDAARLAFGSDKPIDMGGLAAGGGRNIDGKAAVPTTEADKVVRAALGISDADAAKYGADKK